jgi:hypothetical protein
MIDVQRLPDRVMLDSSVLTLTRHDALGTEADLCRELYRALIKNGRTILIPTPAVAEYIRHPPHDPPPRHPLVEIVTVDEVTAMVLGKRLPDRVWLKQKPEISTTVVKYDAMIIACALRGGAKAFISRDGRQLNLAREVGLIGMQPTDLIGGQLEIFGPTVPANKPTPPPSDTSTEKTTTG